jgi:hypothetical protein
MNVQEQVNPLVEAQKIWDQLDAEDAGTSQPPEPTEKQTDPTEAANPAPADNHNGDAADAKQGGEDRVPQGDQALLDKIAGLESMLRTQSESMTQLTQRLRNAEGHIGGLGSQLKQQQQVATQVTAKGGEAPSASELRDAQKSPEAMARLKADYPEFADAMESALNERLNALEQKLSQSQQPVQQAPGVTPDEIARLRSEMAVEIRHPGWQERVRTPEFVGWLQRQNREVQLLAASESPQDAVRLLDLHTEALGTASTQRTQRLNSAAALPTGRGGGNTRTKPVEEMSPQEYWRYLDELDRQKGK